MMTTMTVKACPAGRWIERDPKKGSGLGTEDAVWYRKFGIGLLPCKMFLLLPRQSARYICDGMIPLPLFDVRSASSLLVSS